MTAIPPQLGAEDARPHNWPPLPKFIPIEPCFYQDIAVEIPPPFQNTVWLIYNVFQVYVLALLANCISTFCFTLWASGSLSVLFLAFIQLALFSPCSFLFWFRPVYKAFRNDSSFNFMVFFFVLFFNCIYTALQTVGLSSASTGWINAFNTYSHSPAVALLMMLTSVIFTIALAGMIYSLILVHRLYRGNENFTLDKARQEFTQGAMADHNVQRATTAATQAVASNLIQQTVKSARFEPPHTMNQASSKAPTTEAHSKNPFLL